MIVDDTFFLRHRISSAEHKRKFYVEPHISMRRRTNSIEHCTRASKILPNPSADREPDRVHSVEPRSLDSFCQIHIRFSPHPCFHLEPFSQRWDCYSKQESAMTSKKFVRLIAACGLVNTGFGTKQRW